MSFFDDFFFYGDDDDDDDLSGADEYDEFDFGDGDDGDGGGWFGNEVTLYDNLNEPHSDTLDNWKQAALQPKEFLQVYYDMDNLDIMYQLEDQGLIGEAEWAEWRALYAALYPERAFFHYSRTYGR